MQTRRLLVLLAIGVGIVTAGAPPAADAAVATTDVEHAAIQNLRSVPGESEVMGVSDDDRYVLTSGRGGAYREDLATGERVRVDVYADGTPADATNARLSADGTKALALHFVAA